MFTLKCDMDKYSPLENRMQEMLKSNRTNCYICKSCHLQLQPKCTCVCCNTDVQKDVCKMSNKAGYDFTSFVLSHCLGHVSNPGNNEDQYICTSCDKRLKETSNENPVLPYYGKYPHAIAGTNFLKALNKRPEYCARAQSINQCVDAGQLNIPPQQQPITLSLTKVTLN